MEKTLTDLRHKVTVADATNDPPSPDGFDAVIAGGSVHMHRYQSPMKHYLRHYHVTLIKSPTALFSVCLAVAPDPEDEHEKARQVVQNLLDEVGWKPTKTAQVA